MSRILIQMCLSTSLALIMGSLVVVVLDSVRRRGIGNQQLDSEPEVIERIIYRSLPEDLTEYFSVVDVIREASPDHARTLAWTVGRKARRLHIDRYGCPPRKALRRKSGGSGSHDFAIYPPEMRNEIREMVQAHG